MCLLYIDFAIIKDRVLYYGLIVNVKKDIYETVYFLPYLNILNILQKHKRLEVKIFRYIRKYWDYGRQR